MPNRKQQKAEYEVWLKIQRQKVQKLRQIDQNDEKNAKIYLWDWLYEAFLNSRKGKRSSEDEFKFDIHSYRYLIELRDTILDHIYKPSRGIAFVKTKPVYREVFAAPFRDRNVHRLICDILTPYLEPRLHPHAYSCRKYKGVLYGVETLASQIRSVSDNYRIPTYIIKLDIQGYFMSLPHDLLYLRVCRWLDCEFPTRGWVYQMCKYLWKEIIFDDPTKDVHIRGTRTEWSRVPDSKSLFKQPDGLGLEIGNYSSQTLSNMYLDQLDRFISNNLGYKAYGRYVDDFYFLVPATELRKALQDIELIRRFLKSLGLKLHPKKIYIQPVERGVDFLGSRIKPNGILPAPRIVRNFRITAHRFEIDKGDPESLQSYLGFLSHMQSQELIHKVFRELGWE